MITINFGPSLQVSHNGALYGPGPVNINDSTPEGDKLASDLQDRIDQIDNHNQQKGQEEMAQKVRFLSLRAASGDSEAIKELTELATKGSQAGSRFQAQGQPTGIMEMATSAVPSIGNILARGGVETLQQAPHVMPNLGQGVSVPTSVPTVQDPKPGDKINDDGEGSGASGGGGGDDEDDK